MKTRFVMLGAVALVIVMALAAACGGGDGEGASIRTQKGLAVAAQVAGAQAEEGTGFGGADIAISPGAPSASAAGGDERGSVMAPDSAPFPVPALQESQTGITVQGYGSASVDADSAVLDLYFNREFYDDIIPMPEPELPPPGPDGLSPRCDQDEPAPGGQSQRCGESESGLEGGDAPSPSDLLPPPEEITEADLQPIVDAIVAQGISRADIEVIVDSFYGEPFFDEPFFGGSATIRVTVRNVDALDGIVDAATEAAVGLEDIFLGGTNVSYTVADCAAVERAAMEAAVEDARERGRDFAGVLGVSLGSVIGASSFTSSLFGGSPCDSEFGGPYLLEGGDFMGGAEAEVQLISSVTITFAIQ